MRSSQDVCVRWGRDKARQGVSQRWGCRREQEKERKKVCGVGVGCSRLKASRPRADCVQRMSSGGNIAVRLQRLENQHRLAALKHLTIKMGPSEAAFCLPALLLLAAGVTATAGQACDGWRPENPGYAPHQRPASASPWFEGWYARCATCITGWHALPAVIDGPRARHRLSASRRRKQILSAPNPPDAG